MSKIVVIDDDISQRELLSIILEKLGHQVEVTCSTSEAESKLSANPDLVITDFIMDRGDNGVKALKATRQASPTTPVLVRTGDEDLVSRGDWRGLGFDAASFKVEGNETLMSKVDFLLKGHPRVLAIDSNEDMREILREIFERNGCAIETVASLNEALKFMRGIKLHAIITAGLFEDKTGEIVAQEIKDRGINTPVALLSLLVRDLEIPTASNDLFFARFPKPAGLKDFERLIKYIKEIS